MRQIVKMAFLGIQGVEIQNTRLKLIHPYFDWGSTLILGPRLLGNPDMYLVVFRKLCTA